VPTFEAKRQCAAPGKTLGRQKFRPRATAAPLSWRSCSQKPLLQRDEHLDVFGNVAAKVQHQFLRMRHKLRRAIHDLLQHRLQPPSLGRMTDRRNLARQAQLPQQAQTVVGKRPQAQHAIVGVELARGQPLQIEIRLDLRMELLVRDHQDSLFRLDQTLDPRKGTLVEILGLAGTMPLAGPQFQSDVPAFDTQIADDRTVAIDALISAAHVFFLRIAIVHDEGVDLEAHIAFIRLYTG